MTSAIKTTTVNGIRFEYWSDYIMRGTIAVNSESGEQKFISKSGYISNELTVRKSIARAFNLPTFRK